MNRKFANFKNVMAVLVVLGFAVGGAGRPVLNRS